MSRYKGWPTYRGRERFSTHKQNLTVASPGLAAVREFLDEHGEALINACEFLGGGGARGRALELLCSVADAPHLPRSVERELVAIQRILSAREISHLGNSRIGLLEDFSPGAPIFEDIRLLANALAELLRHLAEMNEEGS